MKRLLGALCLAACLCAACASGPETDTTRSSLGPGPASPATTESQRAANQAAWLARRAELQAASHGQWVLIVGGEVHGPWAEFEAAQAAAHEEAEGTLHAYLFRVGLHDGEREFVLSPFLSSEPHWQQLGVRLRRPWKLTIAAVGNTWYRGQRVVSWGDLGARVQLETLDGTGSTTLRAVASNLFEDDLTLTAADARSLGATRFEAPGAARYAGSELACTKRLVLLRIPELGIESPAMAWVLPEELTKPLMR